MKISETKWKTTFGNGHKLGTTEKATEGRSILESKLAKNRFLAFDIIAINLFLLDMNFL